MLETNCPNCGAPLHFRSADLAVRVCEYCRSTVIRRGEALEAIGKAAEVPEDVSPLQLGVRGQDGDARFELAGRVRWRWTDGGWSEWLMLFDDGSHGWLGESMGRYMLLRPVSPDQASGDVVDRLLVGDQVSPGMIARIEGRDYAVGDARPVTVAGSEGELPSPASIGTQAISVDLNRPDGLTASIQVEDGAVLAYAGRYVTLADITATGLRTFEGWPMPRFAA
jgi:hypothetical protein